MTSPADIAKRLTPAHVRALKDPDAASVSDFGALFDDLALGRSLVVNAGYIQTALGLAVLTELERMGK